MVKADKNKTVSVILPMTLIRRIEVVAKSEQRKLGSMIRKMLTDAVDRKVA